MCPLAREQVACNSTEILSDLFPMSLTGLAYSCWLQTGHHPGSSSGQREELCFLPAPSFHESFPSKIHRKGDCPTTQATQSTFNLFFFKQSPGLEASSCSGRFDSICIVRLSAPHHLLLLRVLTRDQRVCSPAYPVWGLATHIHTGRWSPNI